MDVSYGDHKKDEVGIGDGDGARGEVDEEEVQEK